MSRFAAWAGTQGVDVSTLSQKTDIKIAEGLGPEPYLVDNSLLKSTSRGIRYRHSPRLDDRDRSIKPAKFGSVVFGTLHDRLWLRVGPRFLPIWVQGVQVLIPELSLTQKELARKKEAASRSALPAWMFGSEYVSLGDDDDDDDDDDNGNDLAAPTAPVDSEEAKDAGKPKPGTGELYEVVSEGVRVRSEPNNTALVENIKTKGTVVEMFSWDESRQWRLCFEAGHNRKPGWMMLDHPTLGPLLKPLDQLCVAAARGDTAQLRRKLKKVKYQTWRSTVWCDPLQLAMAEGHLECAALLIRAGADLEKSLPEDSACFPWKMQRAAARNLLAACAGRNFNPVEFDMALADLPKHVQEVAERLFDDMAKMLEKSREALNSAGIGLEGEEDDTDDSEHSGAEDEDRACVKESSRQDRRAEEEMQKAKDASQADQLQNLQAKQAEEERAVAEVPAVPSATATAATAMMGTAYRVVAKKIWIRAQPSAQADGIGMRHQGQIVRMFEFDRTQSWRRVEMGTDPTIHEPRMTGWMLLVHPSMGVLLEPAPELAPQVAVDDEEEMEEEEVEDDRNKDSWTNLFGGRR